MDNLCDIYIPQFPTTCQTSRPPPTYLHAYMPVLTAVAAGVLDNHAIIDSDCRYHPGFTQLLSCTTNNHCPLAGVL